MSGAITATVATVAAMTMAEVFTAVAITGAVVGAVGAVTHVKELQYAGMALGAVGGIGALAVSAGMFAAEGAVLAGAMGPEAGIWAGDIAAVSAVGGAGSGLGGAYTAAEAVGMATGFEAAGIMPSAAGTPLFQDVISMTTGGAIPLDAAAGAPLSVMEAASSPSVLPEVATDVPFPGQATAPNAFGQGSGDPTFGAMNGTDLPASGAGDATQGWTRAQDRIGDVTQLPGQGAGTPGTPRSAVGVPAEAQPVATPTPTTAPPTAPASAPTFKYDSITDLINKQKLGGTTIWDSIGGLLDKPGSGYMIGGGIQAIGSFLAGAMDPKSEAQIRAANAQADLNIAAANLQRQQLQNMSGPMSVAHRVPRVTGAPAPTAPTGLINTPAPPRPAPVTGTPA